MTTDYLGPSTTCMFELHHAVSSPRRLNVTEPAGPTLQRKLAVITMQERKMTRPKITLWHKEGVAAWASHTPTRIDNVVGCQY